MSRADLHDALSLIPARGGSKGIPKKNIAPIGGIPLIVFTLEASLAAEIPGRICLSTDDEGIRNLGLNYGIEAPFLRPRELSRDDTGSIPVILHALDWYATNLEFRPKHIILLQPTSPFRSADSIQKAYEDFIARDVDSLVSANKVSAHPCEYVRKTENGFKYVMDPPEKPGRQNFPEVFFINGAIYIAKVSFLLGTGRLFDKNAHLHIIPMEESLDIDEQPDLEYANWLYECKKRNQKEGKK